MNTLPIFFCKISVSKENSSFFSENKNIYPNTIEKINENKSKISYSNFFSFILYVMYVNYSSIQLSLFLWNEKFFAFEF